MTRRTYVYDADLDAMVDITRSNRPEAPHKGQGLQIIRDLDPYQAVATDVALGAPPFITGRRQHKEFLRRNNYQEVGNDFSNPGARTWVDEKRDQLDRVADVKRAAGYL